VTYLLLFTGTYVESCNIKEEILMKSTGVVRRVDELGRIVIPIELRRTLDIAEKDALEIYVDGEQIILKKYEPACIFCGDARDVTNYKGKNICKHCLEEIRTDK
jgi:AbrB family transcriptional regulator, transcriptional pleiotropic regulator of transition state genes